MKQPSHLEVNVDASFQAQSWDSHPGKVSTKMSDLEKYF